MWFRDYFRNRKKLMDENATLRRQLFYAEKSCDEMAEMLQAVGTERLTPLIHDSCRGCSYAVWRLADLRYMQHAFFWAAGSRTAARALSRKQRSFGPQSGQNLC